MLVSLCLMLVLLFALATVALVHAIVSADDGYEDEAGFHCAPVPDRAHEGLPIGYRVNRAIIAVPFCWFL